MRSIILVTALVALSPFALAQTYPPQTTPPPAHGTTYSPNGSEPPVSASDTARPQNVSQPDPENCGTPDEPKACPPMPRRPLNYYPPNKQ